MNKDTYIKVRINKKELQTFKEFCESKNVKMSYVVMEAIRQEIEQFKDIKNVKLNINGTIHEIK